MAISKKQLFRAKYKDGTCLHIAADSAEQAEEFAKTISIHGELQMVATDGYEVDVVQ